MKTETRMKRATLSQTSKTIETTANNDCYYNEESNAQPDKKDN